MKGKPNIAGFKDPTAFLEGVKDEPKTTAATIKPEPTVQKNFRLRWDTANALRLFVLEESTRTGVRLTETEVIEELLRDKLAKYIAS